MYADVASSSRENAVSLSPRQVQETDKTITVTFEVEDSGVGIKIAAIPMLFKRFHPTDTSIFREFKGFGLGLCLAKQVS
jgi:signal transduction histidine kinase